MPAGQKRAPDLITDACESLCGCWELNSGPLEEQAVLLTAEPSLQPPQAYLIFLLQKTAYRNEIMEEELIEERVRREVGGRNRRGKRGGCAWNVK